MTLPFRLLVTPAARNRGRLYLTIGVLFLAMVVGAAVWLVAYLVLKGPLTASMLALVAMLISTGAAMDWIQRKNKGELPRGTVEIGATRIRCRDLVEGDYAWSELTRFRWVLQETKNDATLIERSDGQTPGKEIAGKYFVIEAAEIKDPAETNKHGYYDRPAIQFDLDDLCFSVPARADAHAAITLLNKLQADAVAGTLRDGDQIEVPAFLNAIPVAAPNACPTTGKAKDEATVSPSA